MKLIVGLGNPGKKYLGTRHNVGFLVLAELHRRFGQSRPSAKFDSELVQVGTGDQKVLLQSPLTFMNASGKAVRGVFDFYKLSLEDLLVVCDDFHLDLGRLRFREKGTAGGQNGLKDIIQKMGSQDFARLRIGVGKPPEDRDAAGYVLSKFRPDERVDLERMVQRSADGVLTWLEYGTKEAMNRFNADLVQEDQRKEKARSAAKTGSKGKADPPSSDDP